MKLRTKLVLYFALLHLVPAVAMLVLTRVDEVLVIFVELLLLLSLAASLAFARAVTRPFEVLATGSDLLREQDFNLQFRHVGQPELDRLVDLYNVMLGRLREERLRTEEKHQLLSKLIAQSPAGVVLLDLDGQITDANASARRLLRLNESGGLEGGRFAAELKALDPGASRMLGEDGRQRLRVTRGEFFDRGFARTFYLVEELTEPLRASEKAAYEKVIRMLSHEINNSVGAVASLLESLQHYAPGLGEEERHDFERALSVSSSRLRSLDSFTRAFAAVVRIPPPQRERVDLAALVADLVTLSSPEAEGRGVTLLLERGEVEIDGDKNQLEQAILNVIRNAIDATPAGGRVHVLVRDGSVVVRDEGSGITPEAQPQLFTPFFTSKPQGRGLGLTIVSEILTAHGAEFSLTNAGEGGAEFRMSFASFQRRVAPANRPLPLGEGRGEGETGRAALDSAHKIQS